jgi:hypothetical protein
MIFFSLLGFVIILIILWDAFESIILPRRIARQFRLVRIFFRILWTFWRKIKKLIRSADRKEYLSYFGPISLILLLSFWAVSLVIGFALFNFGLQTPIQSPHEEKDFLTYLYASGGTFFPVGLIDIYPLEPLGRFFFIIEAGTGFAFLAIVIGYLPVLYQGFSRREVNINLLDSRAGSPPNALHFFQRLNGGNVVEELKPQLETWEVWSAELLETHISYPVLAYYRSQHDNQSWIATLLMILDASALVLVSRDKTLHYYAKATFAIARHAATDLTQTFSLTPHPTHQERLPKEDFKNVSASLKKLGFPLKDERAAEEKLKEIRALYEPYMQTLSDYFLMPITPFVSKKEIEEAWRRNV